MSFGKSAERIDDNMKRVKLIVSYDGTNYCGWQKQPNGITVEEELNKALTDLFQTPIEVIGASRTDAGVHSLGNVAVFDTDARMPAEKISYALNQRLPEDIRIQDSCEVDPNFHPRYADSEKTYQYKILNTRFPQPLRRRDTFFYYQDLNVTAMQKAAGYLVGEHDFKSFCAVNAQVKSTVRTIYSCYVEKDGDLITITVTGNGFLYNMVRIIAGTLIRVGSGAIRPEEMTDILYALDREASGPTAPACGLTMIGIEYYDDWEIRQEEK